jgi:hypothetical protein
VSLSLTSTFSILFITEEVFIYLLVLKAFETKIKLSFDFLLEKFNSINGFFRSYSYNISRPNK